MDINMAITPKYETGVGRTLWRKLLQLDKPVPPRTSEETEAEIERNYRWNFTFNFLDGSTFFFGTNFVSAATVIPLFVSKLTLNPFIIGLIAVLAQAGWFLPQVFTAGSIERVPRKKPVIINLGFFAERLPVWFWPLAALIAPFYAGLALVIFFVSFAWHNLGAGAVAPAWQDLVARCFPVNRRGQWFGLTTFAGTGTGALGALASAWILENYPYPYNFFTAFLIAAIFINLSWLFLSFTREPTYPTDPTPVKTHHLWVKLRDILRQDSNFRHYLQARFIATLGMLGMGFVTVSAIQIWQVSDGTVGFYTFALLLGQGGGNLLAGVLADRLGHKLSLELGITMAAVGFSLAWFAPNPNWYYAAFFFIGLSIGVSIVSGTLISMEFSTPERRPTYMGIANTIVGLGSVIAPLIGGFLALYGYTWAFATSVIVCLLGLMLMRRTVREPRRG
jgi:MFS family permease